LRKIILIFVLFCLASSTYAQENWGPAEELVTNWLGFPSITGFAFPSISSNDSLLFFRYQNLGSLGITMEIAYTCFENGEWGQPVSIQNELNNRRSTSPFYFDQSDTILFYQAETDSGYGDFDIWAIRFENGDWGEPYNLGPIINTSTYEAYPSMPDDGSRLYFYTWTKWLWKNDVVKNDFRIGKKGDNREKKGPAS